MCAVSIHGCSSEGTAWAVSWPPNQSVSSVSTTLCPSRAAVNAAAIPPSPPPSTRTSVDVCCSDTGQVSRSLVGCRVLLLVFRANRVAAIAAPARDGGIPVRERFATLQNLGHRVEQSFAQYRTLAAVGRCVE